MISYLKKLIFTFEEKYNIALSCLGNSSTNISVFIERRQFNQFSGKRSL